MNDDNDVYQSYRVYLQSVPGFYAQYSGSVKVWARNEEEAVDVALEKLRKGSFPDRTRSMWRVEKVEKDDAN